MLKGGSLLKLQDLSYEGKSLREIARESGISRNTVRKYVRDGASHTPKPRLKKGSKLDPFKPTIDAWMKLGLFNCRVMLPKLRELGYTGGMTTLKDYVQPNRPPRRQKATSRYETRPGEQAQLD